MNLFYQTSPIYVFFENRIYETSSAILNYICYCRYIAVCRPTFYDKLCSHRSSLIVSGVLIFSAFIISLDTLLINRVVRNNIPVYKVRNEQLFAT